jgi:hypothetical protein
VGYELIIELTGNASTAAVGSIALGPRTFGLTGNQAQGYVGTLIAVYWKLIDDSQTADWASISNVQSAGWANIDDTQAVNWQNTSNPQTPGWSLIDDEQTPNWEEIEVTT